MTWTFFTDNWGATEDLLADYFPHAGDLERPMSVTEFTAFLTHLAEGHDLTLAETAELLDDLAMTALAHARYVSDVTQRIVASS